MLANVRNRRGMITAVEPYDAPNHGRFHLVSLEYLDTEGPVDDTLIWEREVGVSLIEPTSLPDPVTSPSMPPEEYDAFVRASRWSALTPFADPDGASGPLERLPVISPIHGAVQVEDFQMVPLIKALNMPRVALLIADDVGLGKTIEAGLVLSELINRRRIRRVLVISPASLCLQWQQELTEKFSLSFDIVNREETQLLRKRMGMDANPWRTYSRIITSYYYLKQPDILEQFIASSRTKDGSPHLPWDLLIVDEAHNLTPAPFGEDSELTKMLKRLAPLFEHRIFLTATPHNGHTSSYTGLLERLDPVRFAQTSELSPAERTRLDQVVIRRLKSDINARTNPPRFCRRTPEAVQLHFSLAERSLAIAFSDFRTALRRHILSLPRGEQVAGTFAIEVLGKRLLSCPTTFADSWWRCQAGVAEAMAAAAEEVRVAKRAADEDIGDDRETESRTAHMAHIVGAWLQPFANAVRFEMGNIDAALAQLGLSPTALPAATVDPRDDARFHALCQWIDQRLRADADWRDDERLVIFTEYKTTLDYLERRLKARYRDDGKAIRILFGGMDVRERERIKRAFNDAADPVRVLLATDTGSEGLNLQETARYLLHYDIPWNPARLEQRNGRLDRHGQARDVTVFHFETNDDADLAFLGHVVRKVDTIREDLGSIGELFDQAFNRRFIHGEDAQQVRQDLDHRVEKVRGRAQIRQSTETETGEEEVRRLDALKAELDLDAGTLCDTLDVAMGIGVGRPRLTQPDEFERMRLASPIPDKWRGLIDDTLRLGGPQGPLPMMAFDARCFIRDVGGRFIFRPLKDTVLMHLAHPMYRRVLTTFAHARYRGGNEAQPTSRWTVRRGPIPAGADALLLLTVEEMAVNELRETFHHWVKTWQIPICAGSLLEPLPHAPANSYRLPGILPDEETVSTARDLWLDIETDVKAFVQLSAEEVTLHLQTVMDAERDRAIAEEDERFRSRQGELSSLIQEQSVQRIEREIAELREQREQGVLFDPGEYQARIEADIRAREEELERRRANLVSLQELLQTERRRIINYLLPARYTMHGEARVFPVAVELRLPQEGI
jgi:ERCC4-related helicase